MAIDNQVAQKYMSKIKLFFTIDWVILSISVLFIFYYLINRFSNNSFIFFNLSIAKSLIASFALFLFFIIKFDSSLKIKARLIIEIIDESSHYIFTTYNKSVITVYKPITDSLSRQPDYYLNRLFSPTIGTIHLTPNQCEKFILVTKKKKYYLVPTFFANAVHLV